MKTFLVLLLAGAAAGCANFREIQVDMVNATVIKLDTIYRFKEYLKQVTWQDEDKLEYVSYIPLRDQTCHLGSTMLVLRRK